MENLKTNQQDIKTRGVVSKALLEERKKEGDSDFFLTILSPTNDEQTLRRVLEKLGKLPSDFDSGVILALLNHANPTIRQLAVKNLGKMKKREMLETIYQFANRETNTMARREAVSAIGRISTADAIPILTKFLTDVDPKVVLQAIRGLIKFKKRPEVKSVLVGLTNHPNELIKDVISRELEEKADPTPNKPNRSIPHCHSENSLKNVIVHADVREVLPLITDESIHLTLYLTSILQRT